MSEETTAGGFDDDDIDLSDDDDLDVSDDDPIEVELAVTMGSPVSGSMTARQRLEAYMENKRSQQDIREVFDDFDDGDDLDQYQLD
jgi:hypothetical protein